VSFRQDRDARSVRHETVHGLQFRSVYATLDEFGETAAQSKLFLYYFLFSNILSFFVILGTQNIPRQLVQIGQE
jgi:hypothetical protein